MTALELFVVLLLVGVLIVLFFFYLQDRSFSFSQARSAVVETGAKTRSAIQGQQIKLKMRVMIGELVKPWQVWVKKHVQHFLVQPIK